MEDLIYKSILISSVHFPFSIRRERQQQPEQEERKQISPNLPHLLPSTHSSLTRPPLHPPRGQTHSQQAYLNSNTASLSLSLGRITQQIPLPRPDRFLIYLSPPTSYHRGRGSAVISSSFPFP